MAPKKITLNKIKPLTIKPPTESDIRNVASSPTTSAAWSKNIQRMVSYLHAIDVDRVNANIGELRDALSHAGLSPSMAREFCYRVYRQWRTEGYAKVRECEGKGVWASGSDQDELKGLGQFISDKTMTVYHPSADVQTLSHVPTKSNPARHGGRNHPAKPATAAPKSHVSRANQTSLDSVEQGRGLRKRSAASSSKDPNTDGDDEDSQGDLADKEADLASDKEDEAASASDLLPPRKKMRAVPTATKPQDRLTITSRLPSRMTSTTYVLGDPSLPIMKQYCPVRTYQLQLPQQKQELDGMLKAKYPTLFRLFTHHYAPEAALSQYLRPTMDTCSMQELIEGAIVGFDKATLLTENKRDILNDPNQDSLTAMLERRLNELQGRLETVLAEHEGDGEALVNELERVVCRHVEYVIALQATSHYDFWDPRLP